ncbi:MAG: DNA-directed RNA polymerase subunit omega [Coriobacteriales bacterium]|jgi:DNA-directed RNA polymerase subunit omega|nr:DNA-directed RNA polymerase subunit omega [Coriobacteriales bacterium]
MSLMQPPIDELLKKTENDKFLLCAVASERAQDINDMMRGQRDRAKVLNSANQIAQLAGRKPLSLAMEEIERDEISYDRNKFHNVEVIEEAALETAVDDAFEFDVELGLELNNESE